MGHVDIDLSFHSLLAYAVVGWTYIVCYAVLGVLYTIWQMWGERCRDKATEVLTFLFWPVWLLGTLAFVFALVLGRAYLRFTSWWRVMKATGWHFLW